MIGAALILAVDWVIVSSIVTAVATLVLAVATYSDHELGQRSITRFALTPREDGRWLATVSRHWNVDRPDPR